MDRNLSMFEGPFFGLSNNDANFNVSMSINHQCEEAIT